jgi:hypothetical protein
LHGRTSTDEAGDSVPDFQLCVIDAGTKLHDCSGEIDTDGGPNGLEDINSVHYQKKKFSQYECLRRNL